MTRFRRTLVGTAASCLLLLTASVSPAANYTLDMSHTSIIFGISHLGYSYTYGRFNKAEGKFSWDNANPAAAQFVIAIDAASIDSNDPKRDGHLRNADFFNVNQFPRITFQSTSVRPSQSGKNMYDVTGNMTMHGQTRQVTLPMKKLGEGKGPYGKYRCGFYCKTELKRSDFGMTNMIPNIGDEVAVTISFEGTRDGAEGSGSAPAAGSGSATAPAGATTVPAGSATAPRPGSSGTR